MAQPGAAVVQFTPLASVVSPAFWHALTSLKIDVLRLSDAPVPVNASYGVGRTVHDRETGKDVALGCTISVGESAFDQVNKGNVAVTSSGVISRGEVLEGGAPFVVKVEGVFKNFNTIEEFKAADKTKLFNDLTDEVCGSPRSHLH
jgi:ubiquitin-like modifier-activating enzyme ATG7